MSKNISVASNEELLKEIIKEQKKRKFKSLSHTVCVLLEEYFEYQKSINKKIPVLFIDKDNCVPLEQGENFIVHYKGKAYNKNEGKNCSKCGDWKPFSEYYKDNSRKKKNEEFGYMNRCKQCDNKKKKSKQ